MVSRHVRNKSSAIDFGARSGALLLRLRDLGFERLKGIDLDTTRFDVPDADFDSFDLNEPFADHIVDRVDLATATDVIEHLDSPRNFLTEVRKILNDGGFVAISLPNVAYFEGRIKFLLKGELWGFGHRNYIDQRHISPVTVEQMILMMQEIGLRVVEYGTGGSFATPARWFLTSPIWAPLRMLGGPTVFGECAIFLAQKAEPDPDLKRPLHYREGWGEAPNDIS
jgi:2-polyprenyl-3-methyl-5-hydroxy-6-metoxy-1,4-benzoquinol methylase